MNLYNKDQTMVYAQAFVKLAAKKIYKEEVKLDAQMYKTKEPVTFDNRLSGDYVEVKQGEIWGELWDCAWFHISGTIPASASSPLALALDVSGEACLYDNNGAPVKGFTSHGGFDPMLGSPIKQHYRLKNVSAGDKVDFYVDAACNDLFGNLDRGEFRTASIVSCRDDIRALYYDYIMLIRLCEQLEKSSAQYSSILYSLIDINNVCVEFSFSEVEAARKIAARELSKKGGTSSLNFSAIGHSHLDLAWLWPIRETKRKALRTFSTAIDNINRYPEYVFCVSQPQQLQWVKELSPQLYEKIKDAIKTKRFEPVGAMWVEPDLNISGGESLHRQVLYGNKFWRDEFGVELNNCWLPDVFGFNGALPQILKKNGVDYLCTIKLSWNKYNKFPYNSFKWKGIDESEILTHMPPEGTYNSEGSPASIKIAEKNYVERGLSENALIVYGIGDGGGGPGASHLEFLSREKDVQGICPVKMRRVSEFFELLNNEKDKLPTYKGEMYLEKHQGTYTTQGKNKYYNRRLETLLHNAEFIGCACGHYPDLEKIWKEVLLYQFHDILPGSSIKRVYDESVARYKILEAEVMEKITKSLNCVKDKTRSILNCTPFARRELMKIDGKYAIASVAPYSSVALNMCVTPNKSVVSTNNIMENDQIKVTFGENGEIVSIVNKANSREYLQGKANELKLFYDDGDCWDIDDNYRQKPQIIIKMTSSHTECDGIVAERTNIYVHENTKIEQKITLSVNNAFVKIDTFVDWHEDHKMLRAEFDTAVKADFATFDIQFGKVTRATTEYNSYEFARNEVCAQHYVDYKQSDFGVAVINSSKYGYCVRNGLISLNLLRQQSNPGIDADIGQHEFSYILYAHEKESEADKLAYSLTNPLEIVNANIPSFVSSESDDVILETVKKCESSDDVIVRLFESNGKFSIAKLNSCFADEYIETTMDEKDIGISAAISKAIQFKPFEIKTFRLIKKA